MPDIASYALFVAASLVLLITPGPAVLYIVARSIDQGRLAGIVSTLGISAGTLVHIAAAAFGLSAILVRSALVDGFAVASFWWALAFSIVKYVGAAYLIYLGVRKFMERDVEEDGVQVERAPLGRIFRQGVIVNITNPKTALFFFAYLPQFADPTRGAVTGQIMILGFTFVVLAVISDGLYALAAGTAARWLRGNLRLARIRRYFTGSVYIALGAAAAVSGRKA